MPEDPKPPKPRTPRPLFDTVFGVGGNGQVPTSRRDSPVPGTPHLPEPPVIPRTLPPADAPTEQVTQPSTRPPTVEAAVEVIDLRETLAETAPGDGLSGLLRRYGVAQRFRAGWVAFAVLVFGGLAALVVVSGSNGTEEVQGTTGAAVSSQTTVANATTVPPATTVAPATTLPPTTPTPLPLIIEPLGDGVSVSELALWTSGLGSLRTGDAAQPVLGILAASLGQPDHDSGPTESAGEFGTCISDLIRTVQWGSLIVIVAVHPDGNDVFHGYAVDARLPDAGGPAAELQTVSGLKTGDTVARLRELYENRFALGFTVDLVEGPIYEIRDADGVLLWGPLTSPEPDGIVEGIFSPVSCVG